MPATLKWFSGAESGGVSEFNGGQGAGTPVVQSTTKRSGAYALKCPSGSQATARVDFGAAAADVFCRLYLFVGSNPSVKTRVWQTGGSGSNQFDLNLKTDGVLEFAYNTTVEATGSTPVTLGAWNLVEIHFVRSDTVGGMECVLNGAQEFSRFNLDTNNGTPPGNFALFRFGPRDGGGQDVYYDDMAVGTGAYIGPGQCVAVQGKSGTPTYDAWTKVGAADAFGCWSQTPFDTSKACTDVLTDDKQTMLVDDSALNAAIGAGDTINGAMVVMVAKCAAGTINLQVMRRVAGADTFSANIVINTSDLFYPGTRSGTTSPMGVFTDTRANLAAAEIGARDENSVTLATVEDVWLMVDFTPGLAPSEPAAGSLALAGQQVSISDSSSPNIRPGAAALALTGFAPNLRRVTPLAGSLALSGKAAAVRETRALHVTFQVWELLLTPLTVTFSVVEDPFGSRPTPLRVTFSVIAPISTPLHVTFQVFPETLVDRASGITPTGPAGARRSGDVQGPVAEVTLS